MYIRSPKRVNKMFQTLYKYFIINKKVSIPGIGSFRVRRLPAVYNYSTRSFVSPSASVEFMAADADTDKKFCSFLSKQQQIQELEALKQIADFSRSLKQILEATGKVHLPGFGLLAKTETGVLQFQSEKQLPAVFKSVAAERTIREVPEGLVTRNEEAAADPSVHKKENVGEGAANAENKYWWIAAAALAIVAITAVAYYYYQNGSLR